ncbi:hypothetical protein [Methylobacterium sp. Leaf466]|uniref:hypothetical protein n=1 Tax=Methylobacterium sp. Leaf466 TaxID=1736386 RepID=UPI0006FFF187|nr:hypothetical protein [Methylobacterium sp. Leaf466]KQT82405.1 hypothetical protein ASG59_18610 [Methylobacterium sp. Leaf466]
MISPEELNALLDLTQANKEAIEANTAELKKLNDRLDGLQEAVIEIEDVANTITAEFRNVESLANTVYEESVRKAEFEHYLGTNHEKFHHLGGLVAEVTGMDVKDTLIPTRFGERVARIENQNNEFKSSYVHLLGLISDSLIEVKGQISDPFRKKTALDDLRAEIDQRKRGFQ